MNKDILVCGVGGQGTVLASKLIASAYMAKGETVHSAETIGMAQRGGSVTSHVRIGTEAYSPLIAQGGADIILAFEPAEAVRNLSYLKKDGIVITNSVPVKPATDSLMRSGYEAQPMLDYLSDKCECIVMDGAEVIDKWGSAKFINIALLGCAVASGRLGLTEEEVISAIESGVNPKFVDINKKVFEAALQTPDNTKESKEDEA